MDRMRKGRRGGSRENEVEKGREEGKRAEGERHGEGNEREKPGGRA
jgi:hypothetical protein